MQNIHIVQKQDSLCGFLPFSGGSCLGFSMEEGGVSEASLRNARNKMEGKGRPGSQSDLHNSMEQ